jgi:hypothetical protein
MHLKEVTIKYYYETLMNSDAGITLSYVYLRRISIKLCCTRFNAEIDTMIEGVWMMWKKRERISKESNAQYTVI